MFTKSGISMRDTKRHKEMYLEKSSRCHSCIPKFWNTGFKESWVLQGPQ